MDRFSRNKYDTALYKRKLKQNGVRIISVTENFDDSPESVILESVIEGMAEYYSKNLAREVMKGMKESAYNCKYLGGTPPLGYDIDESKKYVVNEQEAEPIRLIYDLYVAGYSQSNIIDELNAKGYKTKTGGIFSKNSLYSILTNEKYSGVYVFNKSAKKDAFGKRNGHLYKDAKEVIKIEGGMPAIVSKEVFEKAQERLAANKLRPGHNKAKENYLLSSLIRCGECGYSFQGNRRKPKDKPLYVSYRCSCRTGRSTKVCDNKEIKKEYIEEFVLSELERRILNDRAIPVLVKKINEHLNKKIDDSKKNMLMIEEKIAVVEKQINNIITAITNGFIQDEFNTKMEELKIQKEELEQQKLVLDESENKPKITEVELKKLFSVFKKFVAERNIPECKKFI